MNMKKQMDRLLSGEKSKWCARLYGELDFLNEVMESRPEIDALPLRSVLDKLESQKEINGVLTKSDVLAAEAELHMYASVAKEYTLHMVSHAHIDMNWRWGFDETVAVTIDTFRTMLRFLKEYPDFIFTQSQASVYEIIEQYAPEMLREIREYVRLGRWEVIASTWVEPDKNMLSGESMARHILYTKQYLSDLLKLDPKDMEIDFEPDTFGHSAYIPEILSHGGVKYYYHCRGNEANQLYRWRASSGAELLVMKEPEWYLLDEMDAHIAWHVPSFCKQNHTRHALRFYGVGDHGGGPTRRDLEMILDMQTWPLMPKIHFSTLHAFFHALEEAREMLPVVEGEQNFIFTGCYTTQSRIKQANRFGEDRLYDSEALCQMANAAGDRLEGMPNFTDAWKKLLFNQFHDILPGSGVRATREYALGMAQQANARCLANAKRAMKAMGDRIATDAFAPCPDPLSSGDGAGSGYRTGLGVTGDRNIHSGEFQIGSPGNEGGLVRPYTIFNPIQYAREELVELELWDWKEPLEATCIRTANGSELPFEIVEENARYWLHRVSKIAFMAKVPPFGYANVYLMPADRPANRVPYRNGPRLNPYEDRPIVMENEFVRAVFRRETMELTSLVNKANGQELICAPSAFFSIVDEQDTNPHSAWDIGQSGYSENLNRSCFVRVLEEKYDPLRTSVTYEIRFRASGVLVNVQLAQGAKQLAYTVDLNWQEHGGADGTSHLRFCMPYAYKAKAVRCDVPGGHMDRAELPHDVPAILYAAPLPDGEQSGIAMTSNCKYGYRAWENQLSLTLVHGGYQPDPQPDTGIQRVCIGVALMDSMQPADLTACALKFAHPLYAYSNTVHAGTLPDTASLIQIEGDARVVALKRAEDGAGQIIRLAGNGMQDARMRVHAGNAKVWIADILERPLRQIALEDGDAIVTIPAGATCTVLIAD